MKKINWKISLSIIFVVFLGLVFTSPIANAQNLPIVSITGPIDALTTLYNDVAALPTSAFVKPNYQNMVLNMINAAIKETEFGAYYQATMKLSHFENNIVLQRARFPSFLAGWGGRGARLAARPPQPSNRPSAEGQCYCSAHPDQLRRSCP